MTVCKFFQQGYCRYGQNCRFEHIYASKYSYHANPTPQVKTTNYSAPAPASAGVTDEQLVNQVKLDVQAALQGRQWILSCYSPFKEKPIFPGISDLSPEEARLFIYEAKASNTLDQAIAYMNSLLQETRLKYEKLRQPDHNIIQVLKSLYRGETVPSPFSSSSQNTFSSNTNTASSIFRSAIQNTSPFSQNTAQSVFSQSQSSIFSSTTSDPAKELFSKANTGGIFSSNPNASPFAQNTAGSSPFAQNTAVSSPFAQNTAGSSPFAQNTAGSSPFAQNAAASSPFAQNTAGSSPFAQITASSSPFAQNTASSSPFAQPTTGSSSFAQSSVFGPPVQNQNNAASIFSAANQSVPMTNVNQSIFSSQQARNDDLGVYSRMEDLDEEDLEAFKAKSFQLGFVPEIPPPSSLCT